MWFRCEGEGCSCSGIGWGLSCSRCWSSCRSWLSCSSSGRTPSRLSSRPTSSCSAPQLQWTSNMCVSLQAAGFNRAAMVLRFDRRTVVPASGLHALLPLLLHLLRRGVVDVGLALCKKLLCQSHNGGEMVTGVGELIRMDLEHGDIFQNNLR